MMFPRRWPAVALLCMLLAPALAACGRRAPTPRRPAPPPERGGAAYSEVVEVRGAPIGLDAWQPAVAPVEAGGTCRTLPAPPGVPGGRVLLRSFPDSALAVRSVAVTVGADGQTRRYSDVRGDLRWDWTGARTEVTVDLERDQATAMNSWPGRQGPIAVVRAADALDAPVLDRPRHLLALVRSRCGGT
jgi:hypothetical protein